MRSSVTFILVVSLMLAAATSHATVLLVPDDYPLGINSAINDAHNGDTISVWVPEGTAPPYKYYENVDYLHKSLFIVNRSFLPGQTGYDSSWNHVIIDGQQMAPVVRINLLPPEAVATLKGFTIENGTSAYGGGVDCEYSSARLIRNRIVRNHATMRGGGVYLEGEWAQSRRSCR
jgi:hypothetical protein